MLLFVYGTLKREHGNHVLLRKAKFMGEAETIEKYSMFVNHIPYVAENPKISTIKGEIYKVSKEDLERIDSLEGHPFWYERKPVEVICSNIKMTAELYFNNRTPQGHLQENGIFS